MEVSGPARAPMFINILGLETVFSKQDGYWTCPPLDNRRVDLGWNRGTSWCAVENITCKVRVTTEETGQRREAGGTVSCQLKVSSFCSGTLLASCMHHFGHTYTCVAALSEAVGTVKSLYACLLESSVSHRRVAHGPSRFTSDNILSNTSSPYSTNVSLHA